MDLSESFTAMRNAEEVKTFPLLNMPLRNSKLLQSVKLMSKSETAIDSSDIRNTQNVSDKLSKSDHQNNQHFFEKLSMSTSNNLLPGLLQTKRPAITTVRKQFFDSDFDDAVKRTTIPIFESNTVYTNLKFDGTTTLPPPLKRLLDVDGKPALGIVNVEDALGTKPEFKFDAGMEELRNYTMLMDKFGLNQFMIYHGSALTNTPEFERFRKKYNHDWGAITHVIQELEEFLRLRDVKLAIINGPHLHEVASLNLPKVQKEDLISCISNIEEIRGATVQSKTITVEKEDRAAIKIQARVRAFLGRKHYLFEKTRALKAIRIQSYIRRMICQRLVRDLLRVKASKIEDHWDELVLKLKHNWPILDEMKNSYAITTPNFANSTKDNHPNLTNTTDLKRNQTLTPNRRTRQLNPASRLIIMIPSVSAAEYIRLSIDSFGKFLKEDYAYKISINYHYYGLILYQNYILPHLISLHF